MYAIEGNYLENNGVIGTKILEIKIESNLYSICNFSNFHGIGNQNLRENFGL